VGGRWRLVVAAGCGETLPHPHVPVTLPNDVLLIPVRIGGHPDEVFDVDGGDEPDAPTEVERTREMRRQVTNTTDNAALDRPTNRRILTWNELRAECFGAPQSSLPVVVHDVPTIKERVGEQADSRVLEFLRRETTPFELLWVRAGPVGLVALGPRALCHSDRRH